ECDRTFLRWQQLPIESCAAADAYRQFAAQCVELARHQDRPHDRATLAGNGANVLTLGGASRKVFRPQRTREPACQTSLWVRSGHRAPLLVFGCLTCAPSKECCRCLLTKFGLT